jgi:hypothetical protein
MIRTHSKLRRSVLTAVAALGLALVAATSMPTAASAAPPIPCKRDYEGKGCAGQGQGNPDPWVASLFYTVGTVGHDHIYARSDGRTVTSSTATDLARNLHYRTCIPAARSGKVTVAVCQD